MHKMAGSVFAFIIICGFSANADHLGVPAILWTSDISVHYPVSLAGHTLDADTFYKGYLQQVAENGIKNVAVFIQDQFSIDDITRYGDVFNDESEGAAYKSLRGIMEKYESTYLPSIREPTNAIGKLQENFHGSVELVDNPGDLSGLKLKEDVANLVIVALPKTTMGGKLQTLVQIDEIMGKLTDEFEALGKPFCALYTAASGSKEPKREVHHGRQLLQAVDVQNYTFFNASNCVYMYFTKVQLQLLKVDGNKVDSSRNDSMYTLRNLGEHNVTHECNNGSAYFHANFPDLPEGISNFEMKMNFSTHMRYWYIEDWKLDFTFRYSGQDYSGKDWDMEDNRDTLFGIVGYPKSNSGKSYHCQSQPPIKQYNRTEKSPLLIQLLFTDLQLQFDIRNNNSFSEADDCVGFFTIPIWMGLITALVLILILLFGVAMLANINTMDRFDDPKGKTIQVAVGD